MYQLPIELQIEILKHCDIRTKLIHKYYYGLEKLYDMDMLNYALFLNDIDFYKYLRSKGLKFNDSSLQFAIYTGNIDIVKEILRE